MPTVDPGIQWSRDWRGRRLSGVPASHIHNLSIVAVADRDELPIYESQPHRVGHLVSLLLSLLCYPVHCDMLMLVKQYFLAYIQDTTSSVLERPSSLIQQFCSINSSVAAGWCATRFQPCLTFAAIPHRNGVHA